MFLIFLAFLKDLIGTDYEYLLYVMKDIDFSYFEKKKTQFTYLIEIDFSLYISIQLEKNHSKFKSMK